MTNEGRKAMARMQAEWVQSELAYWNRLLDYKGLDMAQGQLATFTDRGLNPNHARQGTHRKRIALRQHIAATTK